MLLHDDGMRHHCPIDEKLERKGLRKTKDRHGIMTLLSSGRRAWSAEQLRSTLGRVDLSTVYRNVRKLAGEGIVREIKAADGKARFELAGRGHHDHVACGRCDTMECVPCPAPDLPKDHYLELRDLCGSCRGA
jgi:Fe2+ or Zn2+ uptake regulation protein